MNITSAAMQAMANINANEWAFILANAMRNNPAVYAAIMNEYTADFADGASEFVDADYDIIADANIENVENAIDMALRNRMNEIIDFVQDNDYEFDSMNSQMHSN